MRGWGVDGWGSGQVMRDPVEKGDRGLLGCDRDEGSGMRMDCSLLGWCGQITYSWACAGSPWDGLMERDGQIETGQERGAGVVGESPSPVPR